MRKIRDVLRLRAGGMSKRQIAASLSIGPTAAGDCIRMFVDYAGTTLEIIDDTTSEVRVCQLFVAVLGASNYTYAEATFTQCLAELYATEVSADLISRVTDAVLDEVREWKNRPLDPVYPVVFFDALRVKIRDEGVVKNKAVYVALALNPDGEKDVLGLWIELPACAGGAGLNGRPPWAILPLRSVRVFHDQRDDRAGATPGENGEQAALRAHINRQTR
jgi:hypothetical protein